MSPGNPEGQRLTNTDSMRGILDNPFQIIPFLTGTIQRRAQIRVKRESVPVTVLVALDGKVGSLRMGKKTIKPGESDRPKDRGIESSYPYSSVLRVSPFPSFLCGLGRKDSDWIGAVSAMIRPTTHDTFI